MCCQQRLESENLEKQCRPTVGHVDLRKLGKFSNEETDVTLTKHVLLKARGHTAPKRAIYNMQRSSMCRENINAASPVTSQGQTIEIEKSE